MRAEHETSEQANLVFIAGPSGSGASTALRMFHELGWTTLQNIPVSSLLGILEAHRQIDVSSRFAIVVNPRHPDFVVDLPNHWEMFIHEGYRPELIMLDCDDSVLRKRYQETQSRYPGNFDLLIAIEEERTRLEHLKPCSTHSVDTSRLTPRELERWLAQIYHRQPCAEQTITLMSFGFKHGLPPQLDLCIDVRFLTNPYYQRELRHGSGRDRDVQSYVQSDPQFADFYRDMKSWLQGMCARLLSSNKPVITIGIGCTGGQHRSVTCVELLKQDLPDTIHESHPELKFQVRTRHRNIKVSTG